MIRALNVTGQADDVSVVSQEFPPGTTSVLTPSFCRFHTSETVRPVKFGWLGPEQKIFHLEGL